MRDVANQPREHDFSAGRASRTQGQAPFAAILGCADSRIAPELAFDQGPGDLFVVRVAGNFVTPEGLASWSLVLPCSAQTDHGARPQ
jgi:carbonic anhydrase